MVGCQAETKVAEVKDIELAANTEGKWIPSVCWNNCGGICKNKVFVKDGIVVRQTAEMQLLQGICVYGV